MSYKLEIIALKNYFIVNIQKMKIILKINSF